jgi:DNA-directed RNA polymerase sigma subunit (sigma70/sigma32)
MIGLMEGLKRFDPLRGIKPTTFVSWWIRGECLKLLTQRRGVHLSTSPRTRRILGRLGREIRRAEGTEGTNDWSVIGPIVADKLGAKNDVELEELATWLRGGDCSFESPSREDGRAISERIAAPGDTAAETAESEALGRMRDLAIAFGDRLSDDHAWIFRRSILQGAGLRDVAAEIEWSAEGVRKASAVLRDRFIRFCHSNGLR